MGRKFVAVIPLLISRQSTLTLPRRIIIYLSVGNTLDNIVFNQFGMEIS
jgi:hypothetical protein